MALCHKKECVGKLPEYKSNNFQLFIIFLSHHALRLLFLKFGLHRDLYVSNVYTEDYKYISCF